MILIKQNTIVQLDGTVALTLNVGKEKAGQTVTITVETEVALPTSGPPPGMPSPGRPGGRPPHNRIQPRKR